MQIAYDSISSKIIHSPICQLEIGSIQENFVRLVRDIC